MDWSDDVAYCVHDVEDAIHEGHVDVGILNSDSGRSEIIQIAQEWYGKEFDAAALDDALVRLRSLVTWPDSYDGTLMAQAALKNLTSHLIGRFCLSVQRATQEKFGHQPLTRYSANVVVPEESRYEVTALKALAARFVMTRAGADVVYERQRQLIADLHAVIAKNPTNHLDSIYLAIWKIAADEKSQKRAIIDQMAALTDVSLPQWHQNLCN
jgi:dGTPase